MEDRDTLKADILEIFSSVQGEGPFMGVKQIFVKFAACNLSCKFCDLEKSFPPKEFTVDKLISIIKQIGANSGDHHSISFTGGEPLLYKDYLKELLPQLKELGYKIYLDTNGVFTAHLKEVIELVDIIAMDFKLPSSTGDRAYWEEHKEFLDVARRKNCFVKAVITAETTSDDIKKAIEIIHEVDKDTLLVIQPVWPVKDIGAARTSVLFDYLFLAEKHLKNTRIMPQMHKVLKAR